ncbi:MAG: phage scaffolding protein [Clostridiales bacterium]|nr:phage scaffolding protein [Clostridiales bacterium]
MERKFLEDMKLDKDTVEKIMGEHGKTMEKQKQQVADITGERDGLKAQLADVATKLKSFDGVDVAALKGEVEKLKGDIAQKHADHQKEIAERDFSAVVKDEIAAAKGKNAKVIMANLDLEKLRGSKNQKEDVAAALKTLQESDGYLFGEGEPVSKDPPRPKVSTGGAHDDDGSGKPSSSNAKMNDMIRGKLRGE